MTVRNSRPALIIANGDLPPLSVIRPIVKSVRSGSGILVCADGGARHAASLGVRPDIILGDLDSLPAGARASFPGTPIVRNPDQESTDLEKAILYCLAARCGTVVVIGAVGDRIDHSTGALGCLRKYGRKLRLRILDRSGELRLLDRSETIGVRPGETFSLIPLGRCRGIVLKGALYPLSGESLELGVREGISNRATGTRLSIRYESGSLLLYRLHREPPPGAGPETVSRTSPGPSRPRRRAGRR